MMPNEPRTDGPIFILFFGELWSVKFIETRVFVPIFVFMFWSMDPRETHQNKTSKQINLSYWPVLMGLSWVRAPRHRNRSQLWDCVQFFQYLNLRDKITKTMYITNCLSCVVVVIVCGSWPEL